MAKYIDLQVKPLSQWTDAPADGVMITNPPYGERISADDMDGLYAMIGAKLKHVFRGYHAWIIGYREEYFRKIGLSPSVKLPLYNGALECELREYIIFDGDYKSFRAQGGSIRTEHKDKDDRKKPRRMADSEWRAEARREGFGGKKAASPRNRTIFSDRRKPFAPDAPKSEADNSENPLARRRNEHALKMLVGKKPALPRKDDPMIRPRRGWKRPGAAQEDQE